LKAITSENTHAVEEIRPGQVVLDLVQQKPLGICQNVRFCLL